MSEVALDDQDLLGGARGLGDHHAERVAHERGAPELDVTLAAHAVHRRDVDAVRDRVRAVHRLPGGELRLPVLGLLRRMPADRRRVEEDVGPGERREPRCFRVPLVPADERADPPVCGVERLEAEVARREVELLVVERVVRNVHLPVAPAEAPVGVEDRGGIVVDAGGAPLEHRGDDDGACLAGDSSECLGGRSRDRFGEVEAGWVLALTEVWQAEELGEADDGGAAPRRFAHLRRRLGEVLGRVGGAAHLREADAESRRRAHARTLPAPGRGVNRRRGTGQGRGPLVTASTAR